MKLRFLSIKMFAALALAGGLAMTVLPCNAQSLPPPLPALTAAQSTQLDARMAPYRSEVDARVAGGDITTDEANRLLKWHEWQVARQVAGLALRPQAMYAQVSPPEPGSYPPVPPDYVGPAPAPYDGPAPGPYYGPPPAPSYYGPPPAPYYAPVPYGYVPYAGPYYWGPQPWGYWGSICTAGFGRHFGARLCF